MAFKKYLKLAGHPGQEFLLFKIRTKLVSFLLKYQLLSRAKIKINNKVITIPTLNLAGVGNLYHDEPWLGITIKKLYDLKKGAFIDVGVNVGQTLLQWKALNYQDAYYGFEPNPVCCAYVMELIKQNCFSNCTLFPVGLSNKNEVLVLFVSGSLDSSASIIEGFRNPNYYAMQFKAAVFKGDDLLTQSVNEAISIIKIDVEGAELEVLLGIKFTIQKYRPFILCEILPIYDDTDEIGRFRKSRQDTVLKIMKKHGYQMYRIFKSGKFMPLNIIENHTSLSKCNYLFAPKEHITYID